MPDSKKKILIIDDDSRNIFALSAVLRSRGYNCISALSGEEGIAMLAQHPDTNVVLVDMMMPEMDGYAAIPLLKKSTPGKSIPVIAVTAQAMVGDKEKCLEAGADAYLSKPVNVDTLLELLNKF